jgi:hypothetical protein
MEKWCSKKMITKKAKIKSLIYFALCALLLFSFYYAFRIDQEATHDVSQNNHIFLGTRFGTSVKETSKALALANAQLLDSSAYLATSDIKLFELDIKCIPINPSWEKWEAYYMPSMFLFDSFVEASFDFVDDQLVSVDVHFSPFAKSKSQQLVDILDKEFKAKYIFEQREESDTIVGAYRLKYRNKEVRISMWVNLTDTENPIIIACIYDDTAKKHRDDKRKQINASVF